MKQRLLFIFCLIVGMSGYVVSQTRTVTNADLEIYRQERLNAEREYRENYARRGLSSPEELELRNEQSRKEAAELSAKLRAESLERQRFAAQTEEIGRAANGFYPQTQIYAQPYIYGSGYFLQYGRLYRFPTRRNSYQQPGFFAGGQFFPTGSRTRPRPLIARPRNPRR